MYYILYFLKHYFYLVLNTYVSLFHSIGAEYLTYHPPYCINSVKRYLNL